MHTVCETFNRLLTGNHRISCEYHAGMSAIWRKVSTVTVRWNWKPASAFNGSLLPAPNTLTANGIHRHIYVATNVRCKQHSICMRSSFFFFFFLFLCSPCPYCGMQNPVCKLCMRLTNDERPEKHEMNQVQMRMNEHVYSVENVCDPFNARIWFHSAQMWMVLLLRLVKQLSALLSHIGMRFVR